MTLAEYLEAHGMSQTAFAETSGVPQQDISKYLRGRLPRPERIRQIQEATNGAVALADWYAPAKSDAAA